MNDQKGLTLDPQPATALWTDSHCHLAMDAFDEDRDEVLRRCEEVGVGRLVIVGTNPGDWRACADLARSPRRKATAGVHPHEASCWSPATRATLEEALEDTAIAAVGEIGLDYHYDLSPREIQRTAFADQLAIASERGLPVVVHSREAFEDTVGLLSAHAQGLRGVIHCFTYGPEEAKAFLDLGLHLSFSGIITFPKAPLIREAALLTPWERLLVETDAPYLAPVPYRGKRCEPGHVAAVGRFVAALKGLEEAEAARQTTLNAGKLFGWE
jgi:TatD DNase family protein